MQRLLCSNNIAKSTIFISFSHILITIYILIYILFVYILYLDSLLILCTNYTWHNSAATSAFKFRWLLRAAPLDAHFKLSWLWFEPVSETLANDCGCFYILAFKAQWTPAENDSRDKNENKSKTKGKNANRRAFKIHLRTSCAQRQQVCVLLLLLLLLVIFLLLLLFCVLPVACWISGSARNPQSDDDSDDSRNGRCVSNGII